MELDLIDKQLSSKLASHKLANTLTDQLIEQANAIILNIACNGNILYCNPFACDFFGFTQGELLGAHVMDTIVPLSESSGRDLKPLINDILENPEDHRFNINENLKKNGETVWVSWSNSAILNHDGKFESILSIGTDYSRQHELEEQVRYNHKMQAIGDLSAGLAHNINNITHGIIGHSDVIQQLSSSKHINETCASIISAADAISDLTRQLLTFSRKGPSRMQPCALNDVMDNVLNILNSSLEKKINIHYTPATQTLWFKGDESQIYNSLINLALNAQEAMPNGGNLSINCHAVSFAEEQKLKDFRLNPGDYICIEIQDSGQGISAEHLPHIFEPFYTAKKQNGQGLGLSSVYGTMRFHEGAVVCKSQINQGTTFELYLPRLSSLEPSSPPPSLSHKVKGAKISIMLVDDEAIVRHYSKTLFELHGYNVHCFEDGLEAAIFYQDNYFDIDLVILDMMMPNMNGYELLLSLRAINPYIKAIIATGYSDQHYIEQALAAGALDYIQKPFTYDLLEAMLIKHQLITSEA